MNTAQGVLLRIPVSEETYDALEKTAKAQSKDIENVAADLLMKFRDVQSTKPIVLNDMARQHLDKLMGRNFTTADELVLAVQRALSVRADGVEIPVTPYLLERLHSRCIGMEFGEFMKRTVKRLLEEFANIR